MEFLPLAIEQYAQEHSTEEMQVLQELSRETQAKVLRPRMLSGHIQGLFLQMISKLIKPQRVLEIGTYTGYSAICLAQGLNKNGILHTIEVNDELESIIRKYINKAGLTNKITLHIGDALKIIPTLNETWDLVFIDADKENYLNYYNLVFNQVKPGGWIITDNVLWSGKVLDKNENDIETQSIRQFNQFIHTDDRVEHLLLPLRDGLMMIRKK
ncbi:MAG: O-methyltransferase [Flavobacteriales bacterium]|nr:O-methyltransferase [Flavobacteriales bacterium]